jgi:predicted nucleotide-binding protein (sugar kinase/HSP70/actin superfamily)
MIPLPEDHARPLDRMYWASGQAILQAARFVRCTPGLFGVFITSFSCGPDSFILDRFRNIMGDKPYLVLELDTHTSDAGLDTRVEAFLEVTVNYRSDGSGDNGGQHLTPPDGIRKGKEHPGNTGKDPGYSVLDPGVKVLVPSMGDIGSRGLAAAMRYTGINAATAPPPGPEELNLGKKSASCRECLPYLLTAGSLHRYLRDREDGGEKLLYLMPEADGPCRFGQYGQALRDMIEREGLGSVQILSPSSNNSYNSFPPDFARRALLSTTITDGLGDIYAGVLTLARDQKEARQALTAAEDSILESLTADDEARVLKVLDDWMSVLSGLKRTGNYEEATRVLLTGEIYVRREAFSSYYLPERLSRDGIVVRTSPIMEWFFYIDHIVLGQLLKKASARERLMLRLRNLYSRRMYDGVQNILEKSGFYQKHHMDIGFLIKKGRKLLDPRLTGEAILTISSTLTELGDDVHGVISVSPFGCMPGRIAEAMISKRLEADKHLFSRRRSGFWRLNSGHLPLPFLALETDGNPLSQTVETKLDSFVLSAHRLKQEMREK